MIGGTILCLGDSITFGARDEYKRSYPAELSFLLSENKQKWICVNRGIEGETSAELLRRLYGEIKACPDAFEVCLLTGTNDARDRIGPEVYERNLKQILDALVFFSKFVYLGLLPEKKGSGAPDYPNEMMKWLEIYNGILESLAPRYDRQVKVVDLTYLPESVYADGIHFKNAGHRMIAEKFFKAIKERRG